MFFTAPSECKTNGIRRLLIEFDVLVFAHRNVVSNFRFLKYFLLHICCTLIINFSNSKKTINLILLFVEYSYFKYPVVFVLWSYSKMH